MPCIFCGANGKMSREHVFPSWLEELFPDLSEVDYLRRLVTFSTDEHHQRPGPAFDVVVRDVCRDCNHGWMERLEAAARPILTPMLLDEPRVMTAVEQHIVGTWATKTMLTMQGANIGGERVVSPGPVPMVLREADSAERFPHLAVPLLRPDPLAAVDSSVGMTALPQGESAPLVGDPMNGFGVAYAIGPLAFWLFGVDLPGNPQTSAGSDEPPPHLAGARPRYPLAAADDDYPRGSP